MRDGRLGRQSRMNQSGGRCSLQYAVGAGTTGVFGTTSNDDAELRRNDIQPLGHVLTDAMQAATTGADQALRLDDLFDARKVGGKRATIGGARFGARFARGAIGFIFGMDGRYGCLQVLQCEIELLGIGLLGFAPESCLLESCDQLLQPFNPIILADFTRLRRDQHRLQGSNIVRQTGGVQHA